MDIRDWPLDKIMQLPDHCFGRRWPISICVEAAFATLTWDISMMALPEKCVIWELSAWATIPPGKAVTVKFLLADQVPPNIAAADELPGLFPGVMGHDHSINYLEFDSNLCIRLNRLKVPIHSGGRRLVIQVIHTGVGTPEVSAAIVVSAIPTEVPDCLLSV